MGLEKCSIMLKNVLIMSLNMNGNYDIYAGGNDNEIMY